MTSITVIGSLNMDLVIRIPKVPRAGETLAATDFHLIPGGKGANQSVSAARAGVPTRMVGCVGSDAFGSVLINALTSSGVDASGVTRMDGVSSGTATIIVDDSGENRIMIVAGANGQVTPALIQGQWESIRQSGLILLQHEIPLPTSHTIIERAHAEGLRVFLNPAPYYPVPGPILAMLDTLILNEGEAAALSGLDVTDGELAQEAAGILLAHGVGNVIITLGSHGAILRSQSYQIYQPAFQVEAVDTTAAGDTFTGGYAASIVSGLKPPEALRYAAAAAALAVTRVGAQTSIPRREEVEAFLAARTE